MHEYQINLESIVREVRDASSNVTTVILMTTIPVDDATHNSTEHLLKNGFKRYNKDVERYNDVMKRVAHDFNCPVIDLNKISEPLIPKNVRDHVHLDPDGSLLLAKGIVKRLSALNVFEW